MGCPAHGTSPCSGPIGQEAGVLRPGIGHGVEVGLPDSV